MSRKPISDQVFIGVHRTRGVDVRVYAERGAVVLVGSNGARIEVNAPQFHEFEELLSQAKGHAAAQHARFAKAGAS